MRDDVLGTDRPRRAAHRAGRAPRRLLESTEPGVQPVVDPRRDGRGRPAHDRGRHAGGGARRTGRRARSPGTRCACSAARTAAGSWSCAARATTAPTGGSRRGVLRARGRRRRRARARPTASTTPACGARSARADLAIDAMFGTGFRGALEGDAARRSRARSPTAGVPVLAVDIPSGVDGATGAVARRRGARATRRSASPRSSPGLLFEPGRAHAGPRRRRRHRHRRRRDAAPQLARARRRRSRACRAAAPTAHKWSSGVPRRRRVDAAWSARRCSPGTRRARCGAGMVVCAVPGADGGRAASSGSELVARALPATRRRRARRGRGRRRARRTSTRFRALAIGPGLGRDDGTQARGAPARRRVPDCRSSSTPTRSTRSRSIPSALHARARGRASARGPHAARRRVRAARRARPVGADRVAAARDLAARLRRDRVAEGPGHGDRRARRPRGREPHRRPRARDRRHRRRAHRHHRRPARAGRRRRSPRPRPARTCTAGRPTPPPTGARPRRVRPRSRATPYAGTRCAPDAIPGRRECRRA